jgi:flagellin-like hook-associated protein FlgL
MSAIPSYLSRAPSFLMAQTALGGITRTNLNLFNVQSQISSGRAINRFSDDSVKAAAISILDDRLERSGQLQRNLQHADAALGMLDSALGDASDLVLQAKEIAAAQVGSTSSPDERRAQAQVVDSLIQSLLGIANRRSPAGYMFAGSTPGTRAVDSFLGGFRYMGQGGGFITDLGLGSRIPLTMGVGNAIGSTSGRVKGTSDLNPDLLPATRIADLRGARGLGVTLGIVEFSFDGGARVPVDLTGADTVQDVVNRLTLSIRDYEAANSTTVLGPGGISLSQGGLRFDIPAGPPSHQLQYYDPGNGITGQDLGLTDGPFDGVSGAGKDLNPKLTWNTPISALTDIGPLGLIRIKALGQSRLIDLGAATTIEDLKNRIQGAGLGLRVEIDPSGNSINIYNEVASSRAQALSIEEVDGQPASRSLTATRLGIRTLSASTRISDFNDGRGVRIADDAKDDSGNPLPTRNTDFQIKLGNGTIITVDLRPQDLATVQTVLDRINQEAIAAGVGVPSDFEARISSGPNGILLTQNPAFGNPPVIEALNNSPAAGDLGLLAGTYEPSTGSFRAEDRAKVRVDNFFTHLIDLRESLLADDTSGITFAGEDLARSGERIAQARALVGSYAQRVSDGEKEREDRHLMDTRIKSDLQDLDYSEAAIRLSTLQMQLQATLQVTASTLSRSLLDFLR